MREKVRLIRDYIPADDATVDAFVNLLEKQTQLKARYSPTIERVRIEALREAIEEGRSASTEAGIWLTEGEIAEGVASVATAVGEHIPGGSERVRGVVEAVSEGRVKLRDLASAMLRGELGEAERAAEQAGVDPAALGSLVAWALQPAYAALSDAVRGAVDLSEWSSGRCPICGSYAALGYIDREGFSHLKCQFCGTEWGYPSGKCPFCGNEEPQLVSIIDLGEGKPLSLSVCHACGGYWKIVDERLVSTEVPRDLYDLWTLILDALARRLSGR